MIADKITKKNFLSKLFSDNNLTKKASLNAVTSLVVHALSLAINFILQPLMVAKLGDYFYGTWEILNRLIMYISPSTGNPYQALRWTLANQQSSVDYERKRQSVASTIIVWAIFVPFMAVLGIIVTWVAPIMINTPAEYVWRVRLTIIVLVVNLILASLTQVPQSVMEGENKSYKLVGASLILILANGLFVWVALSLGWNILGVAFAALTLTLLSGVLYLYFARKNAPWLGLARPTKELVREFLGLSWWFLAWNFVFNFMVASDVVVLGIFDKVETVTAYTLSKYTPETLISIIAIMMYGIAPGLGGIIGSGDKARAAAVRGESMSITWLVVTIFGTSVLLWNRAFVGLWAGSRYFTGSLSVLLIVVVVTQFVIMRNDSNFLDLTLNIRQKVLLGAVGAALSILLASVFTRFFNLGVVGVSLGIILGRTILSIGFPALVGRFLGISLTSQLKSVIKPLVVTITLYILATVIEHYLIPGGWQGITGWIIFFISAGVSAVIVAVIAFFTGLSSSQRENMLMRARLILSISGK